MLSTSVDSASPGRKLVDSLFSASLYRPGRFAAPAANSATRHAPTTTNFAVRPAGTVRMRVTGSSSGGEGLFYQAQSSAASSVGSVTGRRQEKRSHT